MMSTIHLFAFFTLCVFLEIVVVAATENENVCQTDACFQTAKMFLNNMNPSSLPCHNFYDFMCGNYHKANPLTTGVHRESAFSFREKYIKNKIIELLQSNDYDYMSSTHKARMVYENCLDETTIARLGHIPIPLELNILGLPIKPPFNLPLNQPYDFSRMLGKLHGRMPMTKFLFDVNVTQDENDTIKNRLEFNHTPSINHLTIDEDSKEFEVYAFHLHTEAKEVKEKMKRSKKLLKQMMTKVIHYLNKQTNAKYSKKTNALIEKRITEVIDFLMQIEQTKEIETDKDEDYAEYITVTELQKNTDNILGGEHVEIKWCHLAVEEGEYRKVFMKRSLTTNQTELSMLKIQIEMKKFVNL